jgi:hypothetical protein
MKATVIPRRRRNTSTIYTISEALSVQRMRTFSSESLHLPVSDPSMTIAVCYLNSQRLKYKNEQYYLIF